MGELIDGRALAREIINDMKNHRLAPKLGIIMVGDRKDSQMYVKMKCRRAMDIGIEITIIKLDVDCDIKKVLYHIDLWNNNPEIHGVMVQLPLPEYMDEQRIVSHIDPKKDVDGLHPLNLASIAINKREPYFVSCTPLACMRMIDHVLGEASDLRGKLAVVIGRSNIVGLPMAWLLQNRNATVISCDKNTVDTFRWTKQADILISATGVPHLIRAEHVKPGAIVLDVGITKLPDGRVVGDVKTDEVRQVAAYVSPVPGGVGPMTIAMLLSNTLKSAEIKS